ncbi:MAG TPA: mucoidy inhibitor MuiA family protein [Candidatus Methylacidiphilales bacterium]
MNKLFPVILMVLVVTTPAFALTANQKIRAVTVYPDRALVTRGGEVRLDAGIQTIVFDNLPLNLEEDSVRAKAQGKLKILGVEVRRDYKEVAVNAATRQLQDDLAKLDDQIRALNDEQSDIRNRKDFLDKMRDKVTAEAGLSTGKEQPAAVGNMQGLFQMYDAESSKNTTRWREIDFALRDLNRQRADKANQLSLLQQPAAPNTRSALVTVEAAQGGSADLQVSYVIAGAGWEPQYDAYADPETQKVELTYYGVVRQTTGENWDDVALTLSSARPSTAARLPELGAWVIDFGGTAFDGAPAGGAIDALQSRSAMRKSAKSAYARKDRFLANQTSQTQMDLPAAASASTDAAGDAEIETAEVRSLGPSATFIVPARTSIPSDNQPHRSAISVQTLKGEWTYEATPKLVPGAFLKTKVTNTSGGPLLGGEINAFLGNNFVGKSNIGLVAANASFDLFLGVDENIKVTRTEGIQKEEVGGILSRMKLYKRSFTIEVQNFKSTEASFKLRDQLPVSKNGQIAVVVNQAAPEFKSHNDDTGEVDWEFKLKPNEKQKITVEYEIDAPFAQSVAGL